MTSGADSLGLCGKTLKDTFQFNEVVAQGGFGIVYKGRHLSLDKSVALKVLDGTSDVASEAIDLFLQESAILARLEHPAIVRPYDCGIMRIDGYGDLPWIALEWLEGQTLSALLREKPGRRWPPGEALSLLRPVMEALAEAHANGIAHRDVAPNNIMVCDTTRGRRVRLIDFGIAAIRPPDYGASRSEEDITGSEISAHSAWYPAPEQIRRQRTGPWTDVHALGLILHHMLTGQRPYPVSALDPAQGACSASRPTPGSLGLDLGAWEPVLTRAVALDAKVRYLSAGDLLAALERGLASAKRPRPDDGKPLPPGWKAVDLTPSPVMLAIQTANRTAVIHVICPSTDELRSGVELPLGSSLGCRLILQRFAEVSLALSVLGTQNTRPGLYMTPNGSGTRLPRLLLDPGQRSVYCGQRSQGLRELVSRAVKLDQQRRQVGVDIVEASLRVRFSGHALEVVVLTLDAANEREIQIVCAAIK